MDVIKVMQKTEVNKLTENNNILQITKEKELPKITDTTENAPKKPSLVFKCSNCHLEFGSLASLTEHFEKVHVAVKKCSSCHLEFGSLASLTEHFEKVHVTSKNKDSRESSDPKTNDKCENTTAPKNTKIVVKNENVKTKSEVIDIIDEKVQTKSECIKGNELTNIGITNKNTNGIGVTIPNIGVTNKNVDEIDVKIPVNNIENPVKVETVPNLNTLLDVAEIGHNTALSNVTPMLNMTENSKVPNVTENSNISHVTESNIAKDVIYVNEENNILNEKDCEWVFKCRICQIESGKILTMSQHLASIHNGQKSFIDENGIQKFTWLYKCVICFGEYDTKNQIELHIPSIHKINR